MCRKDILEEVEEVTIKTEETSEEITEGSTITTITTEEEVLTTTIKIIEVGEVTTITIEETTIETRTLHITLVDKTEIQQTHMVQMLRGWPKTLANVEILPAVDIQGAEDKLTTTGSNVEEEIAQVGEEEGTEDIILQITKEDSDAKYELLNS